MLYEFACESCGRVQDVSRSVSQRDVSQKCTCSKDMHRRFSFRGQITIKEFQACFHPAFGRRIHSKGDLQNELARYKDEKGSELIEVGNEVLKSTKQKYEPDHEAAHAELKRMLG